MSDDFSLEGIDARLEILLLVLQYCSQKRQVFKTGQRICINLERGVLEECKSLRETNSANIRNYQVPAEIEEKIKWSLMLIEREKWTPKIIKDPIE